MDKLAYKPGLEEALGRLRLLHGRQGMDRIFATFAVPSETLKAFAAMHPEGFCAYPDPVERVAFWDGFLGERAGVEDDSVPCAYLSEFDQGLYGGLVGGQVQFMCHPENGWISSMVAPLLQEWSEFDRLRFDRDHPWFRRFVEQLRIFVAGATGKFGISHFILIDSLNFAFELVGASRTYVSLFEAPGRVHQAIDFAFDLNLTVQETFFAEVPLLAGGTVSNMVQWAPGRIISESVDPFHMTSVEYFDAWGREPVERIFARFDGGVLHLHGNGRHLLEAICAVQGLRAIFFGEDRGFPPAIEILDELRQRAGDMPLVVTADFATFAEKLKKHQLPGGVLYKVEEAPDVDAVNRCMEEVRKYRV